MILIELEKPQKILFLQIINWNNIIIRSLFGFVTMIMVFSSLQLIPIGLTTALAQSSAIYVTLLFALSVTTDHVLAWGDGGCSLSNKNKANQDEMIEQVDSSDSSDR